MKLCAEMVTTKGQQSLKYSNVHSIRYIYWLHAALYWLAGKFLFYFSIVFLLIFLYEKYFAYIMISSLNISNKIYVMCVYVFANIFYNFSWLFRGYCSRTRRFVIGTFGYYLKIFIKSIVRLCKENHDLFHNLNLFLFIYSPFSSGFERFLSICDPTYLYQPTHHPRINFDFSDFKLHPSDRWWKIVIWSALTEHNL